MACVLNAVITTVWTFFCDLLPMIRESKAALLSFSVSFFSFIKSANKLLWKSLFWDPFLKKHVVSRINLKTGTYLSNIPRTRAREWDLVVESNWDERPRSVEQPKGGVGPSSFLPLIWRVSSTNMAEAGRTCPLIMMFWNVQDWCVTALFLGI